ncbi:hypothetical protein AAAC51_07100 [Priestia megaterium]
MVEPLRQFYLHRLEDVSGVSGTGVIGRGVIMPSGHAVMEWTTKRKSIAIYESVNEMQILHAHNGKTELVYLN